MDCIDSLKARFHDLTEDEILQIMEEVKIERKAVEDKMLDLDSLGDELLSRIDKKTKYEDIQQRCRVRAETLGFQARVKALDFITSNFKGKEWEGLEALLGGVNKVGKGNRFSVDALQKSKMGFYLGGFTQDLKALGNEHFKLLKSGKFDREVAKALWLFDNPNHPDFKALPQQAKDIAKVVRKWQGKARSDANLAGAWIGERSDYITRQTHDASRIKAAGYAKWAAEVNAKLDWQRTAPNVRDRDAFLRAVFENITEDKPIPTEFRPAGEGVDFNPKLAEQMSESRVLVFKDSDAWMDYNSLYGYDDTLMKTIGNQLGLRARQTALMEKLGPDASRNFNELYNTLQTAYQRAGNMAASKMLEAKKDWLFNLLHEVDGTVDIPRNPTLASVARGVRLLNNWTMLGGSVISSFVDIGTMGSEFSYQGKSFLGTMARGMKEILDGRGSEEQQRIASQLGVFFDCMLGEIANRYSPGDGGRGLGSLINQKFFQLNGLSWWTDSWRRTVGLMMSHDLAQEKGIHWNNLSPERQRVLKQYGIEQPEWELIRQGKMSAADGRDYLTPEAASTLSDAQVASYLGLAPGETLSAPQMDRVRNELADKLRTYFRDRIDYAVLDSDAKSRTYAYHNTAKAVNFLSFGLLGIHEDPGRGTLVGEALRMAWQFKTFPLAHMERVIGRDLLGREGEGFASHASAVASMFLVSTLFGYASMTVKDVLKGRVPRNPLDFEDGNFQKVFFAAAAQGGGAGLLGDFFFGEVTRHGNSRLATLLGPTVSTLENFWKIGEHIAEGDGASAATLSTMQKLVPGNQLWWFKPAFDYLVAYNLYEMMSPGYFDRMKNRVESMNNQTFFARPAMAD